MQYTHIWLPLFATGVQCPSREAAPCRLLLSSTTVEHRSAHTPSRCPGQHMSASISLQIQTKYQLIRIHTRPILLPAASTSLPNQTRHHLISTHTRPILTAACICIHFSANPDINQSVRTPSPLHFSVNPDKLSTDQYTHQANANSGACLCTLLCQPRQDINQSVHTPDQYQQLLCMSASTSLPNQTRHQLISTHTRPILLPTVVYVCIHCSANPDETLTNQYTHQANANSCACLHPLFCQPRQDSNWSVHTPGQYQQLCTFVSNSLPTQTRHQPTTYTVNSVTELCSQLCSFFHQPKQEINQSVHTPGHRHTTIHVQSIYICVSMSDNHDKRLTNTRPGLKTLYIYYIIYMSAATSLLTKTSKTKQKSTNQSPHQDKALSCLPQHQLLCQPRQD